MSRFNLAMRVMESPEAGAERELARRLLQDLLNADGRVRFMSIVSFHNHICRQYHFSLVEKTTRGVQPGGFHLFYTHGNLLLRVKTSGTFRRPRPHMTLSLAASLRWQDEVMKVTRNGEFVPKLGAVPRAASNWRALLRLGKTLEAIEASDDRWAEACHFDFVRGFDSSGAAGLPVQ